MKPLHLPTDYVEVGYSPMVSIRQALPSAQEEKILRRLFVEARRYPLLGLDERRPQPFETVAERNAFLCRLMLFVMRFTHRGRPVSLLDQYQAGFIGLIRACKKYDAGRSSFLTYAAYWIRSQIIRQEDDTGSLIRLPAHCHLQLQRFRRVCEQEKKVGLKLPDRTAIADSLGVKLAHLVNDERLTDEFLVYPDGLCYTNADPDFVEEPEGGWSRLADQSVLQPEQRLQAVEAIDEIIEQISTIVRSISRRLASARPVFMYYYGLDGHGTRRTLEATGEQFNVTRERVRQQLAEVWVDLRRWKYPRHVWEPRILAVYDRIADLEDLVGYEVGFSARLRPLWEWAVAEMNAKKGTRRSGSPSQLGRVKRYNQAAEIITTAVPSLTDCPGQVFRAYYGLDGHQPRSHAATAAARGLSKAEATAALAEAWKQIRRVDRADVIPPDMPSVGRIMITVRQHLQE